MIFKITWREKVSKVSVLSRIHIFKRLHARWSGHVARISSSRPHKRLICGELTEGKRSAGGQKQRYKDRLKVALKDLGIDPNTWETLAQDRSAWRSHVHSGAEDVEKHRIAVAQKKRELRKSKETSSPDPCMLPI